MSLPKDRFRTYIANPWGGLATFRQTVYRAALLGTLVVTAPDISASLDLTLESDVIAASASVSAAASAGIVEAADTVAGAAAVASSASAAIPGAADTISGAAAVRVSASAALVEASDSIAGAAAHSVSASAALVEAPDAIAGTASARVSASANLVSSDTISGNVGTQFAVISASAALVLAPDVVGGSAAISIRASAAIQGADNVSGHVSCVAHAWCDVWSADVVSGYASAPHRAPPPEQVRSGGKSFRQSTAARWVMRRINGRNVLIDRKGGGNG